MNEAINGVALSVAIIWPLLLAIPALHSRLPWPRHLAILPAALLLILPGDLSLELPWLLFGTGFALDSETRWILAMSLAVWFTAATITAKSLRLNTAHHQTTTLFLLTLCGNLAAVLASDLVGFFTFSTLMGYGFYGLLIQDSNESARRAGRHYLIFLIVADLLLFEALLLAAYTSEDLHFEALDGIMAGASSSQTYLWMVFIGFTLKAGVWPAHRWLMAVFSTPRSSSALLLGGVPIAMALFGAVRWLPLGEHAFGISAMIILGVGVIAVIYWMLMIFMRTSFDWPAWISIAVTGLFIITLGVALTYPDVWRQYEYFVYPLIASVGIFMAVLFFNFSHIQRRHHSPAVALPRASILSLWTEQWFDLIQRWVKRQLTALQSIWRASRLKVIKQNQRILNWQKPVAFCYGWNTRITLFVLLGLALAWLAG